VCRGFRGIIQGFSFGARFFSQARSWQIGQCSQALPGVTPSTEFPIDKKRATFEFLDRVIHSAQTMSVNTANECTSYMSKVHEVEQTLGQVTFIVVKEVMFLMEMTNFQ